MIARSFFYFTIWRLYGRTKEFFIACKGDDDSIVENAKPMTLLKGNALNSAKARNLDLVLRKKAGETKFPEMVIGATEQLLEHKFALNALPSEELCAMVSEDKSE